MTSTAGIFLQVVVFVNFIISCYVLRSLFSLPLQLCLFGLSSVICRALMSVLTAFIWLIAFSLLCTFKMCSSACTVFNLTAEVIIEINKYVAGYQRHSYRRLIMV